MSSLVLPNVGLKDHVVLPAKKKEEEGAANRRGSKAGEEKQDRLALALNPCLGASSMTPLEAACYCGRLANTWRCCCRQEELL